jgi:SPW repeat-containing protein
MKWVSWVNFGLGLWLIFAPITFGYSSRRAALHEDVVFGVLIASVALWRALGAETPSMARVSWVVAAAGFWMMLGPFELGYGTTHAPVDNDVLVGLAVLVLGMWRAISRPRGGTSHMLAHR